MNRNNQILFKVFLFVLAGASCYAQEKTKTYKETFHVGDETVLNIDTSHADIEFETWTKHEVEITAVVELEGASDEEAEAYFEKEVVKILGNSKEIQVKTRGTGFSVLAPSASYFGNFDIVIPDAPMVEPLFEAIEIPELPELPEVFVLPELPPVPPAPMTNFDYDAYRKDGDAYLKEWKKSFDKSFNKEYQKKLEEWGEKMEKMTEERQKQREELREQREAIREEARAVREEARAARDEARAERDELRSERNEERRQHRIEQSIRIRNGEDSNIFYFSSDDGENKKYKVKKSIKIKMPKSVKLKMNVRHGEVKLAVNTKNINASLSYASLLASTIDGDRTDIRASYSPIVVQQWNYGQLKTDFSDHVDLKEVKELKLNSISSSVTIDKLVDKVLVTNNLGNLQINSVADGFSSIDITVENGEVDCVLPKVPFAIYVNETTSEFKFPEKLAIGSSRNYGTNVHKGYHINNKSDKSININAKYSEIVLKE